jgi:hypothetical protein
VSISKPICFAAIANSLHVSVAGETIAVPSA